MNIPKAMKVGGGQTELKLDIVLQATAKKGNENYKNKRHCGHSQRAFFLPPVIKVRLTAFFTQDKVCLRLGWQCTRQPLLRVRPSARTAIVHGVRWSCSLFFTTFYR